MRVSAVMLGVVLSIGCVGLGNGMPTEELIFEKPLYLDAARAARKSDRLALENIIKQGVDVNYESKETKTPWGLDSVTLLLWATVAESLESVEALLKAGADPNKGTNRGMVPLTVASALKDDDIFELLLIRYKADPNKILRAIPHKTPLMVLLQERRNLGEKRFQRAEMLIRYGADVNLGVDGGETAVIAFSIQGDWRAVYWLLEHGANPEVRDSVNGTVMCYLRNSYRANTLAPSEAFTYRDKVRTWLLARGVARSRVDPAIHPSPKCDD